MSRLSKNLCPLLTEAVIKELEQQSVRTVVDFLESSLELLTRRCSLSFTDLSAVRRVILAKYSSFPISAVTLYDDVASSTVVFSTGCHILDSLLDGGLYTGEITELIGQSASGKSQVCIGTALNAVFTTAQNVLYIDSSGSMTPDILQNKVQSINLPQQTIEQCCSRLRYSSVFDVSELLDFLHDLGANMKKQTDSFFSDLKLLVIDTITAVLAPIIGVQQSDGYTYMKHIVSQLKALIVHHSLAVLVVNQTVSGESGEIKPALGKSWLNVPNTRVLIQHTQSGQRKATLVKSCRQATGRSVAFDLSETNLTCTKTAVKALKQLQDMNL